MNKTGIRKKRTGGKQIGTTIAVFALAVAIILGAAYGSIIFLEDNAHASAEKLVNSVVNRINNNIAKVEKATLETASAADPILNDADSLIQLVHDFVGQNDSIMGSTIAFEPDMFPEYGKSFAPYSWMASDRTIRDRQLGEETDYYQEEWYAEAKARGTEYWCEPYFDEGGAKIMMCTFSVPVKDGNGKVVAVLTADIGLDDLEKYIISINPYPDSSIILRSAKGEALVNKDFDLNENSNVFIKGLTEIGWTVELVLPISYLLHGNVSAFVVIGSLLLITIALVILVYRILRKYQTKADDEYMSILEAIAAGYDVMYRIDLEKGATDFIKGDENAKKFLNIFDATTDATLFENFNKYYVDTVIHEDDRGNVKSVMNAKNMHEKLKNGNEISVTYRAKRNLMDYVYTEMDIIKAGNKEDELTAVILAFKDVDENVRKEEEYKKSIEQGLKIINGLANDFVSLYTVNLDDNTYKVYSIADEVKDIKVVVDMHNDMTTALCKYADGFVHEEDRQIMYYYADAEHIREALRNTSSHRIMVRRNINGDWKWMEMNMIKCEPEDQEANNVILAFANRDSQVKEEQDRRIQTEEALNMARFANQAKTNFLNAMSHDIRTPMNAIMGYSRMAKKHTDDPIVLEDLNKIEISGNQLLSLINQVLEMSRIESGKIVLEEVPVDIIERANAMKTVIAADCNAKNIDFTLDVEGIVHRHVFTDDSRLSQIVTNVMGNAVKFTPEGGSITYYSTESPCEKEGYGLYTIKVTDTGIGMSEEYLSHIFEEFTREKTSTVSHIQGTGLGMSIVKKLIDLMGGTIEVKSKPGEGTGVTIILPLRWNMEAEAAGDKSRVYDETSVKGKRLLLVEDNEMNREIACDILEEAGFIVETAEDGDIAVEMVKKTAESGNSKYYDAVLMDIQMPRMNGYEATKAIKALPDPQNTHLPIIALSANAFEEDRQKSLEAGMDDHVGKPIDIQKLKETLAKYL